MIMTINFFGGSYKMHRGTVFIITKDNNNNFEVQKSTEFMRNISNTLMK